MTNPVTEQELIKKSQETGGERVTLEALEANIASEWCFTAADGAKAHGSIPGVLNLLTFCVIVLKNGFTVTGQSACADPTNFDPEIGRRLARQHAVSQIWPLMGYALRERLHQEEVLLEKRAFGNVIGMKAYETFIGTKVVHAEPMNRLDYNKLRGWELPDDENGDDEGYLVEYTDRIENPPHVPGFLGYVSWSPKEVFERAYRPVRKGAPATAAANGSGTASGKAPA